MRIDLSVSRISIIVLICGGMMATGCASMDAGMATSAGLKALQAVTISDSYIKEYVGQYITQLDAQSDIATGNDPYNQRLQRIAGSFNNRDGIFIKVYRTPDVNAFAVADGNIRIYSGLMDIMSDEEILGVIGHEIGHIHNKDTRDAFRRALLTSALREGIASAGGTVGALSASQLGALGEALVQSQYSQKQEFAADDYGYEFLKKHGINPWAMSLSLEKLEQMERQYGNQTGPIQQLFSTHPDITNRKQRLAKRAQKEGYSRTDVGQSGGAVSPAAGSQATPSGARTDSRWIF